MEFQIEENLGAELGHLPHRFRPSRGKQLAADLETCRPGRKPGPANLNAVERESKSSATIRLLRGWASKVKVGDAPEVYQFWLAFVLGFRFGGSCISSSRTWLTPELISQSSGLRHRIHQFRVLLIGDPGH